MIEIFTNPREGGDGAASRSVGTEVTLTEASDVYFSSITPGIAFYEKSGADLLVTLLDGREVTIKRFFVVGPSGDFSRLLKDANGEEEVTGLLAPEPVSAVPRFDETETPQEEIPDANAIAQDGDPEADQIVANAEPGDINGAAPEMPAAQDGDAAQGARIPTSTLDKIFVGSAGIATLALMSDDFGDSGDNRETSPPDPVDPPTEEPDEPEEPTDPGDPDVPTDPDAPTDPVEPTDPDDPDLPTDPGEPGDPTTPEEPDSPQAGILDPILGEDGLVGGLIGAVGSLLGADGLLSNLLGDDTDGTVVSNLTGEGGLGGDLSDLGLIETLTDENGDTLGGLLDPLLGETEAVGGLLVGDGDPLSSLLDDDGLLGGTPV